MEDLEKIEKILSEVQKNLGIGAVIVIIVFGVIGYVLFVRLKRNTEIAVEEASEKALKKFQFNLDNDLHKSQTKHQKQIDAVQETFQKFQEMTSSINQLLYPDPFVQPVDSKTQLSIIVNHRNEFKKIYESTRLLFPINLCNQIDEVIPTVDNFVQVFHGGMFELTEEDIDRNAEENGGMYISGIWGAGAFNEVLDNLKNISEKLESEFRKIYGTDQD